MDNLKGIVYLSEEQYKTLKSTGTITVGDITLNYDKNVLYVTDDKIAEELKALGERVTVLENTGGSTGDTEGNILLLGADGVIEANRVVFTIQDAESFIDYRTNQREFLIDMLLPLVGTLDDELLVAITFGDKSYNVFNSLSSTTPMKIGDLKSASTYNTDTGYRFYSKFVFVETSDVVGFVVSPATINAKQLNEVVESNDSIVVGLDSTETKLSLHLNNEITNKLSRTLVTPVSRPSATELVAVDSSGNQTMLELGTGLSIENNVLNVSGGGTSGGSVDLSNYYTKEETDALFVTGGENLLKVSPVELTLPVNQLLDGDGNWYKLFLNVGRTYEIEYIVEGVTYKQQGVCFENEGIKLLGLDFTDPSNPVPEFQFTTTAGHNYIVGVTTNDLNDGIVTISPLGDYQEATPTVTLISLKETPRLKYALRDDTYTKAEVDAIVGDINTALTSILGV